MGNTVVMTPTQKQAEDEKLNKHKKTRDDLSSALSTYKQKVSEYGQDSENAAVAEGKAEKGQQIWNDYKTTKEVQYKEITDALGGNQLDATYVGKYKEDKREFDSIEKVQIKNLKESIKQSGDIETANTRLTELSEVIDDDINLGQKSNENYKKEANQYVLDGKNYPEEMKLSNAEKYGKDALSNNKLLRHKLESAKSKSKVASTNIKTKYHTTKLGENDSKANAIIDQKKVLETTKKDMQKYKEGNDEFDSAIGSAEGNLAAAHKNLDDFKSESKEKIDGREVLDSKRSRQYSSGKFTYKSAESRVSKVDDIKKKIDKQKIKITQDRQKRLTDFMTKMQTVSQMQVGVDSRYKILKSETSKIDKKKLVAYYRNLRRTLKSGLDTKLNQYLTSDRKFAFEEEASTGGGLPIDIICDKLAYDDTSNDVVSNSTDTTEKDNIEKENKAINEQYQKYTEARKDILNYYHVMKKFNIPGNAAPSIMKLARRVKLIKNAKSGKAISSQYSGFSSGVLKLLDKVEGAPGSVADKVMSKASDPTKGFVKDTTSGVSMQALDTAGEVLDSKDSVEKISKSKELEKVVKDGGKLGADDAGKVIGSELREDYGVKSGIETGTAADRFNFGMNIISVVQNGYGLFKELLTLVKEFSGGADKREKTKRILSVANQAVECFDSAVGFLDESIPLLSTIKAGLTIILKIVDYARSEHSDTQLDKRKSYLKTVMMERHLTEKPGEELYNLEDTSKADATRTNGVDSWFYRKTHSKASDQATVYQKRRDQMGKVADSFQDAGDKDRGTDKITRLDQSEITPEVQRSATVNDTALSGMYTRMHKLRKSKEASGDQWSATEKEKYDERMRRLEALSTSDEYMIASEASRRMQHKKGDDIYEIIKGGVGILADFLKVTSSPAAIAGLALSIGTSIIDVAKSGISTLSQYVKDRRKTFYSTQNKEYRRNQYAESIYDRLSVVADMMGSSDVIDTSSMKDWEYVEAGDHIATLNFNLCTGLDAYVNHITECDTKEEMIEQISSAFSVEGN